MRSSAVRRRGVLAGWSCPPTLWGNGGASGLEAPARPGGIDRGLARPVTPGCGAAQERPLIFQCFTELQTQGGPFISASINIGSEYTGYYHPWSYLHKVIPWRLPRMRNWAGNQQQGRYGQP